MRSSNQSPNTRIGYLYRDGSNYKKSHAVIVTGLISWDDIQCTLEDGPDDDTGWFIASQVGLPDIQQEWLDAGVDFPSSDDHGFSEISRHDFQPTSETPTIELTASVLIARFRSIERWDEESVWDRLGVRPPQLPNGLHLLREEDC